MLTGDRQFGRLADVTLPSPIDFAECITQLVHLTSLSVTIDWAECHGRATAAEVAAVRGRVSVLRLQAFLRLLECVNDSSQDIRH
jgi:hypothetical protein